MGCFTSYALIEPIIRDRGGCGETNNYQMRSNVKRATGSFCEVRDFGAHNERAKEMFEGIMPPIVLRAIHSYMMDNNQTKLIEPWPASCCMS